MEITVIDVRDLMGWAASVFRVGELSMTSVRDMVANVLNALGDERITRLNIIDHGQNARNRRFASIQFGDDRVHLRNLREYEGQFRKLTSRFDPAGIVHFQHCWAGLNLPLLTQFAKIFDTPVYGGTGKHAPWVRINFGEYVVCYPDGRHRIDVPRPVTPPPSETLIVHGRPTSKK